MTEKQMVSVGGRERAKEMNETEKLNVVSHIETNAARVK